MHNQDIQMYQEPTPAIEKMIEKACNVLIDKCCYFHPLDIEKLLKEINAEYEEVDFTTPYHKQYYPYLIALKDGVKRWEHRTIVNERKKEKIREAKRRFKNQKSW